MNKFIFLLFIFFTAGYFSFSQNNKYSAELDSNFVDLESNLIDGLFAIVGGHAIFHSDINNQILQYQTQGLVDQDSVNIRQKVIDELLLNKLLLHFADLDSLEVDNSEIESNLNQRLAFFEQQFGSMEKVEQYFQKSINELSDELKPMIRNQLLTQKMQYDITKNVNVSPLEVANFYGSLDSDNIPMIDAQFQIAHILKIPDAANSSIEETLSKLEDLRNRILNGADFATMAILYSEDPSSSRNGGAYFNAKKGLFVKEFEAVAFSLTPGEISEIFKCIY